MILAEWNNHKFEVSSQLVRGFKDLTLKGSSTTKDVKSNEQVYKARKNGDAYEITLTAYLSARLGITDVRGEAMAFVEEAQSGASAYFYCAGEKLRTCQFMLKSAEVKNIELTVSGAWISCEIGLTFNQSTLDNGELKKSSKKSTQKKTNSLIQSVAETVTGSTAQDEISRIQKNVTAAVAASTVIKTVIKSDNQKVAAVVKKTAASATNLLN